LHTESSQVAFIRRSEKSAIVVEISRPPFGFTNRASRQASPTQVDAGRSV
jgi:hypothetical protein